jgi:hypothetical protein
MVLRTGGECGRIVACYWERDEVVGSVSDDPASSRLDN